MTEAASRPPLETLVLRTPPEHTRAFFRGAVSIRKIIESQQDSRLGLPLRGAMPMFWAADGLRDIEDPSIPEDMVVEIPVGTHNYVAGDGVPRVRSPMRKTKAWIIKNAFSEAGLGEGDSLTLLDEIQGGGTVTHLANGSLQYAYEHGLTLPLHLIAAEDTRVAAARRSPNYRRISTNQRSNITTTVVRIPLIGCDRDSLLDRVDFVDEQHRAKEPSEAFLVKRNTEAEYLFRALGSIARMPELSQDEEFLKTVFEPLLTANAEVAEELKTWIGEVFNPA